MPGAVERQHQTAANHVAPSAVGLPPIPRLTHQHGKLPPTGVWQKYAGRLTWGKGQTLALLDDGCDLTVPEWQVDLPWGRKVVASYNSFEHNDDPTPVPPGCHGTSVGFPSSLNHNGVHGVAYNNHVAQVRCVTIVHLKEYEDHGRCAAMGHR